MYENLSILAAFVFLYSVVAGRLERTPINGALVFTAFGLALGPIGIDLLHLNVDTEGLRSLAELTLALVLFTDASNANLGVLERSIRIPRRLLLIGLPLTILLGFGVGVLMFHDLGLLEIAILATMLAPTDAALGKAVVTAESVPLQDPRGAERRERPERRHLRADPVRLPGPGGRTTRMTAPGRSPCICWPRDRHRRRGRHRADVGRRLAAASCASTGAG